MIKEILKIKNVLNINRNTEDIKRLLRSGADKVSINTAAVENPDFIKEASDKFGSQCIVVAVDAKATDTASSSWEVVTYGGRKRTGKDVIDWVNKVKECGAGEILLTSMDRDGTKEGFDNKLTKAVSSSVPIPVIVIRIFSRHDFYFRILFVWKSFIFIQISRDI